MSARDLLHHFAIHRASLSVGSSSGLVPSRPGPQWERCVNNPSPGPHRLWKHAGSFSTSIVCTNQQIRTTHGASRIPDVAAASAPTIRFLPELSRFLRNPACRLDGIFQRVIDHSSPIHHHSCSHRADNHTEYQALPCPTTQCLKARNSAARYALYSNEKHNAGIFLISRWNLSGGELD